MDISTNRIGCVVLEGGTDEIIEKKSRFIAQVFPVQTEQEAMQIIEQTKRNIGMPDIIAMLSYLANMGKSAVVQMMANRQELRADLFWRCYMERACMIF